MSNTFQSWLNYIILILWFLLSLLTIWFIIKVINVEKRLDVLGEYIVKELQNERK